MALGDLVPSTPTFCEGPTAVSDHILTLSIAATTDFIKVVPVPNRDNVFLVFKIERDAA